MLGPLSLPVPQKTMCSPDLCVQRKEIVSMLVNSFMVNESFFKIWLFSVIE